MLADEILEDFQIPLFCTLVDRSFEGIRPAKFEAVVCRITCSMQRHIFHWQITQTVTTGKKGKHSLIQLTSHTQAALGQLGSKILLMFAVSGASKEVLKTARALFNQDPAD